MTGTVLGPLLHAFLVDHLAVQKGLRRSSISSYRDTLRLFLGFVAADKRSKITRLALTDLTFERVLAFLRHLEESRHNHPRTRNQRMAALHTFFDYVATRSPEMLTVCQRVAAIPTKRSSPREIRFLERDDVAQLFARLPTRGVRAQRDRALLLFLYNSGARAQEVADLRLGNIDFGPPARVRLHGKGGKWRSCPLWEDTAILLRAVTEARANPLEDMPVFADTRGRALTRFGIYKLVRRHAAWLDRETLGRVTPHVFRHTTAVHLLESGVEMNVIRGWLGHVNIDTTSRYAEINMRSKEAALAACDPPVADAASHKRTARWRSDEEFLAWLSSL
jgi:site-specific recombinase XerD